MLETTDMNVTGGRERIEDETKRKGSRLGLCSSSWSV